MKAEVERNSHGTKGLQISRVMANSSLTIYGQNIFTQLINRLLKSLQIYQLSPLSLTPRFSPSDLLSLSPSNNLFLLLCSCWYYAFISFTRVHQAFSFLPRIFLTPLFSCLLNNVTYLWDLFPQLISQLPHASQQDNDPITYSSIVRISHSLPLMATFCHKYYSIYT